jgi:hypothetical protein
VLKFGELQPQEIQQQQNNNSSTTSSPFSTGATTVGTPSSTTVTLVSSSSPSTSTSSVSEAASDSHQRRPSWRLKVGDGSDKNKVSEVLVRLARLGLFGTFYEEKSDVSSEQCSEWMIFNGATKQREPELNCNSAIRLPLHDLNRELIHHSRATNPTRFAVEIVFPSAPI